MKGYRGIPRIYHQVWTKAGKRHETATWYATIWQNGRSTKVALGPDRAKALARLKELLPLRLDRLDLTLADLMRMVREHYRVNGRKSADHLEVRIGHLTTILSDPRAVDVTTPLLRSYQAQRLEQGAAPGTINNELAALSLGFSLAYEVLGSKPKIPRLAVHNARQGFFELAELRAVLERLPEEYHALIWCAFYTGWWPKSELLTRQWRHCDFQAGWLRLDPGETKNHEGREFPLIPALREALVAQRKRCDEAEQRLGRVIPWIFLRPASGERIVSYFDAWEAARKAAGLPGRLVYDLRRTAVRNLERAGVPRSAAMAMVGHRSQLIYNRYAIVDSGLLTHAGELLQALHDSAPVRPPRVVGFTR